jgi:hypothetical protein
VGNPTADEVREWKEESGKRNENSITVNFFINIMFNI